MQKWRYTVMQSTPDEPYPKGLEDLNRMGDMGWELCGIVRYPNDIVEYYYKAPRN